MAIEVQPHDEVIEAALELAREALGMDAAHLGIFRAAMEELRAVVFELRPGSLEAEGLATVLRKHVDFREEK